MADRAEIVEAALEVYPEGLALLDLDERVVFWNRAAEFLTGYPGMQMLGKPVPGALQALTAGGSLEGAPQPGHAPQADRGTLVHVQHWGGRDVPALARRVVLRDALGGRIGTAAVFHTAEGKAPLPHGETCDGSEVQGSQADLSERLEAAFSSFQHHASPLGLLWITVDQAHAVRRTHGARACEAMLESVERTLANALRPDDEIGRWGDDEFLVLSREQDPELLRNRAQVLVGIARTTEFHWWGDRLTLTVSVGTAAAEEGETLATLLESARRAMESSVRLGGNHVTAASGGQTCSRS